MKIADPIIKNIIAKLLHGNDYRIEVITLINAEFLQFAIMFFKKIVEAKFANKDITIDWYKKEFLDSHLPKTEIAINSGLNEKTIRNMYNSSTKAIVIDASNEHYDLLFESIKKLVDNDEDLDLTLTIKFKGVSVELNISESLIVINALAVKRSALRGGLWSSAGKRVEKPLMLTLCNLFNVDQANYSLKSNGNIISEDDFEREVDFYLIKGNKEYKCEVKLMGRGNPESADAVIARNSNVFVADKLSETNIRQLNSRHVEWVELRRKDGFNKFEEILEKLEIPHEKVSREIGTELEIILNEIFK